MKKNILIFVLATASFLSFGQGCNADVTICTAGVAGPFDFDQTTPGPPTDFADPVGCSTGMFGNDFGFGFIVLYITQSGPLNLLVSGNNAAGFIDVVVYDIPSGIQPCDAVMNSANEIGCNYATASVGCTQFGSDFPCTSSIPAPNVVAGQTIMIIVHDYSTQNDSFTLDLGPSGAQTGPPDTSIQPVGGTVCMQDAPFQLQTTDLGGNWTGSGVASDGTFDPMVAGAGTHTLTYSLGTPPCSSTSSTTVTVVDCNIPTCSVSASSSTPICVGGSFDLTASDVSNVISYSWSGPGFTSSIQNPVSIPSPAAAGSYNYTVTATIAGATCTSTTTLVVNPLPNVNAGADQSICDGSTATLTAFGATSYSWNSGVTNGVPFTPVGTQTYTVTGQNANGCTNTDQVVITVNPLPVVNAGTDVTICSNQTVTLSGSGAQSYTWSNGVIDNIPFTPIIIQNNYTVTGTDANGCTDTDQVMVTVLTAPALSAGNDVQICIGQSVTLAANGSGPFTWNNGITDNVSFTPTATAVYTVSTSDLNGCTSTDNVTVTVNPLPAISAGPDLNACIGSQQVVNGSGGATYSWNNGITNGVPFLVSNNMTLTVFGTDVNGCQNSDQMQITVLPLPVVDAGADFTVCQNTSITLSGSGAVSYIWNNTVTDGVPFNIASTTTYSMIGTDANGCSNVDQITVTVNPNPVMNAGPDQAICINSSTILNGTGAASIAWDNGVQNGVSFTPIVTQTYTLTGVDGFGCIGTDAVTITVNQLPNVDAGTDVFVCDGDSYTPSATGALTYVWTNGLSNNQAFVPSISQTYTVVGTDANGCQNSDQVFVEVRPLPIVQFIADTLGGCSPLTVNFTNLTPSASNSTWLVNDSAFFNQENLTLTLLGSSDCYDIDLTTTVNGCTNTLSQNDMICVNFSPSPHIGYTVDRISDQETELTFINTTTGAVSYIWNFGDSSSYSTEFEPIHLYNTLFPDPYLISLTAFSELGCPATTLITFTPPEHLIYFIPNTFTPDGNELNNTFEPVFTSGFDIETFNMKIYNRWGNLLFESLNPYVGWDGTYGDEMVPNGIYHYKIEFITSLDKEPKIVSGFINLVK